MALNSFIAKIWARRLYSRLRKEGKTAYKVQESVLRTLIQKGATTAFGKHHGFKNIKTYQEFKDQVPLSDYEALKPYIERAKTGEKNVLWPGIPKYFAKTSGTTSGAKYIPITDGSIKHQIAGARNALLSYIANTGKTSFLGGKMIFLQGSPSLENTNGIPTGRLSGIVAHHVPAYLLKNRMPSFQTNCIEDWEEKVDAICKETLKADMRLISGIPPWAKMYFEKLLAESGKKTIAEIFKHFTLFVHGGVNFRPYKEHFNRLIGKKIDTIETYPASEGFIAFQDAQDRDDLLLIVNGGIFYEFVPLPELEKENPKRLHIGQVELGISYAIILNTNAGLWGYKIGDCIEFTSLHPPRIKVVGRTAHYISAFGEHVIASEVEQAMSAAIDTFNLEIGEFHLSPMINPQQGLPYHQWIVEVQQPFSKECCHYIDHQLQEKNRYYKDLIQGGVLSRAKFIYITPGRFNAFLKSQGKLGGQNKVPRLANNRKTADALLKFA